jgi:hypothetical protein
MNDKSKLKEILKMNEKLLNDNKDRSEYFKDYSSQLGNCLKRCFLFDLETKDIDNSIERNLTIALNILTVLKQNRKKYSNQEIVSIMFYIMLHLIDVYNLLENCEKIKYKNTMDRMLEDLGGFFK